MRWSTWVTPLTCLTNKKSETPRQSGWELVLAVLIGVDFSLALSP